MAEEMSTAQQRKDESRITHEGPWLMTFRVVADVTKEAWSFAAGVEQVRDELQGGDVDVKTVGLIDKEPA